MNLFKKLFRSYSDTELNKVEKIADKVISKESKYAELSDEQLRNEMLKIKELINSGIPVEDLIIDSFSLFREVVFRVTNLKAYKVQIMGATVLTQGRIAEMKTGEGKSLTILFPAFLRSLEGNGCHVVSVNDYLVERDAKFAAPVFEFLGLSVGYVLHDSTRDERREAYNCDVTYVTNSELGFDYLRDNLISRKEDLVLRSLHFCIIDEVDSILIDEAKTPLIISNTRTEDTGIFIKANSFVRTLTVSSGDGIYSKKDFILNRIKEDDGDYIINRKDKQVYLTENGIKKAEEYFHIDNLADVSNLNIYHCIMNALNVNYLMVRDKDYIVDNNLILVVDEYTGRALPGRRFSHGIHQAIEAKEGLHIKDDSSTLATITFQSFFNKYDIKSGCTGTAKTEEKEFQDIYSLDTVVIPTNKPVIRIDHNDAVYRTKEEKIDAIISDILDCHLKGQPVLVGTTSVESSELFHEKLNALGVEHTVLNAKLHKKEAEIISKAGQVGSVTIATNMAGRGTDIQVPDDALELGGLKVIGSERHESRRIDNQLIGRTGRQGNKGESKFYLSLEDDLMKMFCPKNMMDTFTKLGIKDGQELKHPSLTTAIEKAQMRVESDYFQLRKDLLEFDKTNDEQRNLIYDERHKFLVDDNNYPIIRDAIETVVSQEFNSEFIERELPDISVPEINNVLNTKLKVGILGITEDEKNSYVTKEAFLDKLISVLLSIYDQKRNDYINSGVSISTIEKQIFLTNLDKGWSYHLDDLDFVRQGIYLQQLGGKDPYLEYKFASYDLFNSMIYAAKYDTVVELFNLHIDVEQKDYDGSGYSVSSVHIGDNDLCPCGSGKIFSECCGGR